MQFQLLCLPGICVAIRPLPPPLWPSSSSAAADSRQSFLLFLFGQWPTKRGKAVCSRERFLPELTSAIGPLDFYYCIAPIDWRERERERKRNELQNSSFFFSQSVSLLLLLLLKLTCLYYVPLFLLPHNFISPII